MEFDDFAGAMKMVYEWHTKKNPAGFTHRLIDMYLEAGPHHRVRVSMGFKYLAEATAVFESKGQQIFIDTGLMKPPVHVEGGKRDSQNTTNI